MPAKNSKKTQRKNIEPKANAWALFPMVVFIAIYVVTAALILNIPELSEYFTSVPLAPAFIVALVVAMQQDHKGHFQDKLAIVGRGIGNSSIIYMIIIFILAGLFAGTVGRSSASSVAYFMLDFIPADFAVLVIFIVSCIVSLAMGTSVGSITLMTPIAISVATVGGQDIGVCVACVICGSMFGDNLSMISDTCIAACTGIGCEPREKFTENAKMVCPAAIITIILICAFSVGSGNGTPIHEPYDLVDFIPYILVLILSLCGLNVCVVLGIGILSGVAIMAIFNGATFSSLLNGMTEGVSGMYEIIFITILVAAISELIKENGGFAFVLKFIRKHCHTKKIAQLSTGVMVAIIDIITANNTVAIVVSSPIAKEVSKAYEIRRRRMASITDTFSCIVQGILPYGAQMMIAVLMCNEAGFGISALDVLPHCAYQYILLFIVVIFIITGLSDKLPSWAKGQIKKIVR